MANQYSGSFEHKIKEKFHCTAEVLLHRYAEEGLSYGDVERRVGISQGTIRKWTKRYGIELDTGVMNETPEPDINKLFFAPEMNIYNILSRKWRHAS